MIYIKQYAFVFFFMLLSACSSNNVEEAKDGYILRDSNTKIGAAFKKYPFFKKISWATCSDESGRKVIQVVGEYDLEKVRNSTPFLISPIEDAAFAPLLSAAKSLSPNDLDAEYVVQFTRGEEKAGKLFEVEFAGFRFSSSERAVSKAIEALRAETRDAGLRGLSDIYSGNTATIQLMMGAIELASKTPGNIIHRPIGSFNQ